MRKGRKKEITAHLEDYLVAIYEITQEQPAARVSQIAKKLGVSLPSVTNAMKRLAALKYVNYEKYNVITLTNKGKKRAKEKVTIQQNLRDFFINVMGLDKVVSEKLARAFSHHVDDKIHERFNEFYQILKNFNVKKAKELENFIKESKKKGKE